MSINLSLSQKVSGLSPVTCMEPAERWHTSSAVTQVRLCKTFLVSRGLKTRECKSEGKEERMTKILLMKNELNVLARAAIEE